MSKIIRTFFLLSLLLTIVVLNSKVWSAESPVKAVILKVDGMTCASCPAMVKTALKNLDGVVSADVGFKDAKATVKYKEGKVTIEQMLKAIEGIGMKASIPK